MGFFDRLGAVATGVGGVVAAPFGFVKDVAEAAFTDDDEFDGILGTLWGSTKKWGGSAVQNLIGPDEGLGAAIGALPGSVRRGVRTVTDPALEGLETAGREVIREPLTALMSAASLMDAGKGFDLREGYRIAQNRSLGQAIALAVLTDDITDEVEVAKATATDWYDGISGTSDALARLMLEPDVLLGKVYRGARRASVTGVAAERTVRLPGGLEATLPASLTERAGAALAQRGYLPGARAIRTKADLDAALVSPELATVNERISQIKREAGVVNEVPSAPGNSYFTAEQLQREAAKATPEADGSYFEELSAHVAGKGKKNVITRESIEVEGQRFDAFVQRDPEGAPLGVAAVQLDDGGRATEVTVGVRPDRQRQGIGTALYQAAKDAGHDVEAVSGASGYTPAGAAFALGRAKAVPASAEKAQAAARAKAAAQIRDLAFHDHKHGETIATVLAEAPDLNVAWGALMGRRADIDALAATRADLAGMIDRQVGTQAKIANLRRMGFELPEEVRGVEAALKNREIDQLYDIEAKLLAADQVEAMVREMPRISGTSELRRSITRSDFYQKDWRAAPLRMATNMRPRNFIQVEEAGGDIQVARMLRKGGVADEIQDQIRGEYMAATDAAQRMTVAAKAEAAAIRAIAEKHGIDPGSIDAIINLATRNNRIATMDIVKKSRVYEGSGKAYIEDIGDDGVVSKINVPVAKSQTFNSYLTADLDAIDKIFKESKTAATRMNTTVLSAMHGTAELMEGFNRIWKPSVLLRVGWPIRVVGEEQLRIMSQIGAFVTLGRSFTAAGRYGRDATVEAFQKANKAVRRIPADERVARDPRTRGLKLGTMNINGWEMERAFGTPDNVADVSLQLNSAKGGLDALVGVADEKLKQLRKDVTGDWSSISAVDDPESWSRAWVHAVNGQIGGDAMWRQFLEGKTLEEVGDWIRNTAEGRAYLRTVPHWKNKVDDWLEVAKQTADDYLPTDELKALALQGKATADDIIAVLPDAGTRPVVHGAVLQDIKGGTAFRNAIADMRDKAMRVLGTLPTDVLSRQPYFDWHYTNEVRRLVTLAGEQGIEYTPELAAKFSKQARTYALGESKKLLYDLAEDSELAHTLRFISPFFNASQEVITRWTGIAVDNPAFVLRMQQVWRAPEKAGIVQDENGNTISADGTYATSALGERVEKGKERFLNMRLLASDNALGKVLFNDLTRALPGVKAVETARFNKDGFNTIMQMPGVGPMVQIPLNEIAKGRPELEASLKWALPFGATQNTLDAIMPATAKRLQTVSAGEEDRQYANTVTRFYMDMLVDYNLEKRPDKPTYEEAKKRADQFWQMRTVASFISPVAPSFQSPYQFYIDKYRALMERDPATATDKFLEQEGEDFFPLTQSLTKTMNGVPPTVEGAEAYQKYQDMIQRHPDLGGLIIGEEGAGEFSNSVYQSQLQTPLRPGSRDKQRTALSFEEVTTGTDKKLAWREYTRTMDLIEAARIQRGLPNLQVKGAQDLAAAKRAFIEQHAERHPEWFADFSVVDRNAWNRKLTGLKEIAADDRLAGREEIQTLRQYLEAREMVVQVLAARDAAGGSATITASSNMDLAGVWQQITGRLVQQSLPFSDVYYRFLERDPLTPSEEAA